MTEQSSAPARPVRRRIGDAAGPAAPPAAPQRHGDDPATPFGTSVHRRITPPATVGGDQVASPALAVSEAPITDAAIAADGQAMSDEVVTADRPAGGLRARFGAKSRSGTAGGRRSRAWVVAGVVIAALLAGIVVLASRVHSQDNLDSLRSSALSTGSADGVLLSSYDYRNLTGPGSAWSKLESKSTPTFRKSFLSTSGSLGAVLRQYNATADGKVISAGLASVDSQRAVVLLFIDQTVHNSVQKSASATQPLRSEVTLLRQNGQWLLNDLQVPK